MTHIYLIHYTLSCFLGILDVNIHSKSPTIIELNLESLG